MMFKLIVVMAVFIHWYGMFAIQGLLAAEREDEVKELVAELHQERMDGVWKGDMLQHLIQQQADIRPDDVGLNNNVNGTVAPTSLA